MEEGKGWEVGGERSDGHSIHKLYCVCICTLRVTLYNHLSYIMILFNCCIKHFILQCALFGMLCRNTVSFAELGSYTHQDFRYAPYPQQQQQQQQQQNTMAPAPLFRTPSLRPPRWPVPSLTSGLPSHVSFNGSLSYQFYDQQLHNDQRVDIRVQ